MAEPKENWVNKILDQNKRAIQTWPDYLLNLTNGSHQPHRTFLEQHVAQINRILGLLTFDQRVEVISSLAYCINCGDDKRGKPCNCRRDE